VNQRVSTDVADGRIWSWRQAIGVRRCSGERDTVSRAATIDMPAVDFAMGETIRRNSLITLLVVPFFIEKLVLRVIVFGIRHWPEASE